MFEDDYIFDILLWHLFLKDQIKHFYLEKSNYSIGENSYQNILKETYTLSGFLFERARVILMVRLLRSRICFLLRQWSGWDDKRFACLPGL